MNHDIFIQLSRHEGQPLGIMEAMSYGLPIIASEESTFGDIIKENKCGIYYKTKQDIYNLNSLKEIILNNNSRKYAVSHLSWKFIANKTINEYKRIMED